MTIDRAYKVPLSYQWNATYQREIGFGTTLEVGYVGTAANFLSPLRGAPQSRLRGPLRGPLGTTLTPGASPRARPAMIAS